MNKLELPGCTPEPLMAYLKALGILRLVSEQKDEEARGWWKKDVFWLRSPKLFKDTTSEEGRKEAREALVRFFLDEYKPTPIVAPWAGGSGFFRKDNKDATEELAKSTSARVGLYTKVIQSVQVILQEEDVGDKPRDDCKKHLIRRYRSELPEQVAAWMDAAMVLHRDGQGFAPLLGTGGNDGRLDFTQNFMQRIVALGLHEDAAASQQSQAWLVQALFMMPAKLDLASVGQFAPGRAGGPNATHGMEGDSIVNPWEFIMMMEGTLVLAGAAVRRFGAADSARAAFPFTVRAVAAGFDSASSKDEASSRGELWLPVWNRETSLVGLRQLFGEGRAEVSGRAARDGMEFACAVASLGVDRGIAGFSRLAFLRRSGKAFLALPLGRFAVADRAGVDLLRQLDPWLIRFRRAATGKEAPPRFDLVLRRIDSAIFEFCKCGGVPLFQRIVTALGAAERALREAEQFRNDKKLKPLAGLSGDWIKAADDGSPEFAIARALAAVHDPEDRIGPLRTNLEPVDWRKRYPSWAEKDRNVVWNVADLATNLTSILERRVIDGSRAGCERLPIASSCTVPLGDVAAFLAGELDDRRITDLIWGLMLIKDGGTTGTLPRANRSPVPRDYALLKLLFLPGPLAVERQGDGGLIFHLQGRPEPGGISIRPELAVLNLLRGGRLGEACAVAMRRLRASGLNPMPGPIRGGRVRDNDWRELDELGATGHDTSRLAAALLIPIHNNAVSRLCRLVVRGNEAEGLRTSRPSPLPRRT
ncbi:MAG: type I-U CRISPR-associated protein Csx17 [Phycisphaerae bacterium]|nr:type I-U CRISPR-associated protein Csx17 [Phycisphaerae bacterium]